MPDRRKRDFSLSPIVTGEYLPQRAQLRSELDGAAANQMIDALKATASNYYSLPSGVDEKLLRTDYPKRALSRYATPIEELQGRKEDIITREMKRVKALREVTRTLQKAFGGLYER